MSRLRYSLLLPLVLLVGVAVAAPELAVHLDRERIGEGETVQLTLAYNGEADFEPDISVFEQDFELLGQSRSHHTRIVNGRIGVRQILKLDLAPRRAGRLVIPEVHFDGVHSAERVLRVDPASSLDPASRTHFIEADVSTHEPWVQQQVIYRVRIYQRTPVIDGSLSEPVAEGVTLERLGSDRSYREARDGVEWDVHERRYALFPQRSGKVSLDAVRLLARVAADGNESGSFFNRQTRQIRLRGPTVDLAVKAAPAGAASGRAGWWLPATTLTVTANWLDADAPRVGDPVTLELIMTAHGTLAAQLPELVPSAHGDAKLYAGQSETGARALASGLVSQRRVRHQIVPTRAGELQLEPITFDWFSTQDEAVQHQAVSVPPLTVLPAVARALPGLDTDVAGEPATNDDASADFPGKAEATPPVQRTDDSAWTRLRTWLAAQRRHVPTALVLLAALAGLAVGAWLWGAVRRARMRGPGGALRRLAAHMRTGHRDGCQQALIDWAAEIWRRPPRSLPAIAERLGSVPDTADLARRVLALDQALHRNRDGKWRDPGLARALRRVPRGARVKPARATGLPSLGAAWSDAVSVASKKSA